MGTEYIDRHPTPTNKKMKTQTFVALLCGFLIAVKDVSGVTITPPGDLDHLTADVASKLKQAALDCGWYTACQRYAWPIYESESNTYLGKCQGDFDELNWFAEEIVSPATMENVRSMFYYMAWYTANSKVGYFNDANNDMDKVNQYRQYIIDSGEMTTELVDNMKWMAHDAGWYQQNVRWLYWPGADSDEEKMNANYDLIVGQFIIQEIKFNEDSGKLYSTNTVMQRQMDLPNNSDFPQHTGFEYTVVQGTTSSTTHKLDFGIDIGVGLDIKILFITAGLSAHFKVGAGAEWTSSMSTGEIEKYEYDLYVPAHSQYHAEAVVEEGLVSMDYEIVFTVSGKYHSLKGTWEGTAVDSSTYTVCDTADRNCG